MKYEIKTVNLLIILGVALIVFGSIIHSSDAINTGEVMIVGSMIGAAIKYFLLW